MSDKYLYCETLTGEWWYKDMETGEDLPMYATPIERKSYQDLNNECFELYQMCKQLKTQLQQKENIIKEVREYITTHKLYCFKYDEEELFEIITDKKAKDEILKILDKENKE